MIDFILNLWYSINIEKQIEKFEDNIRKMKGLDKDVDLSPMMKMMYWDKAENDRPEIPVKEATKEQWDQIQYLGYNDGSYSACLVFSNYMLYARNGTV